LLQVAENFLESDLRAMHGYERKLAIPKILNSTEPFWVTNGLGLQRNRKRPAQRLPRNAGLAPAYPHSGVHGFAVPPSGPSEPQRRWSRINIHDLPSPTNGRLAPRSPASSYDRRHDRDVARMTAAAARIYTRRRGGERVSCTLYGDWSVISAVCLSLSLSARVCFEFEVFETRGRREGEKSSALEDR